MSNPRAVPKSVRSRTDIITRTRPKVHCFCKKCNGKLVDPRTKDKHELKYNDSYVNNIFNNNYQEAGPSNIKPSDAVVDNVMEWDPLSEINDPLPNITDKLTEAIEPLSKRDYFFLTKKIPTHESAKYQMIKKGKISDLVLENLLLGNERNRNDEQVRDSEDYGDENRDSEGIEDDDEIKDDEEDSDSEDLEDDEEDKDFEDFEDDDEEEVNFASTDFDDGEPNLPNISIDDNCTWIILWILRYQQRYKLSNIAIDSLFKFLRFFLLMADKNKFSSFPSSLYVAKKTLGISTNIIKYGACNKCHKLYDINEISNKTEIPTCSFINYPNHSQERFRKKCNNPLVKKIDSNRDIGNNSMLRPIMTFPLVNIKRQLTLFFGRKNFERSC